MGQITGWYYLHVNKELIYKNSPDAIVDIRDSDLCTSAWAWDSTPEGAYSMLVEALSIGAKPERIAELYNKYGFTEMDDCKYAEYIGIKIGVDGDMRTATTNDFINLMENDCGFGKTNLEAIADLCTKLGYKGGKMWNTTFYDLCRKRESITR